MSGYDQLFGNRFVILVNDTVYRIEDEPIRFDHDDNENLIWLPCVACVACNCKECHNQGLILGVTNK